jgi:hypothetical protein
VEIRQLVYSFIKRSITNVSLILCVVNGANGLNQAQVTCLAEVLQHLGSQVARKTCLLVTHFDLLGRKAEEDWLEQFKQNEEASFLVEACGGGVLFTGALDEVQYDIVELRARFVLEQQRRMGDMFERMIEGEPVSLMSPAMKDANSMLANLESMTTSCMSLRGLLPELRRINHDLHKLRQAMLEAVGTGRIKDATLLDAAKAMVTQLGVLDSDDLGNQLDDGIQDMEQEYERIGQQVAERYDRALSLNNTYTALFNKASALRQKLTYRNYLSGVL